jgi:hypothetical protein
MSTLYYILRLHSGELMACAVGELDHVGSLGPDHIGSLGPGPDCGGSAVIALSACARRSQARLRREQRDRPRPVRAKVPIKQG